MKYRGVTMNFSQASKELTHWLKSLLCMVVNFGKTSVLPFLPVLPDLPMFTPLK